MNLAAAGGTDVGGTVAAFAIWALLIAAYWVPTIIAAVRRVPAAAQVVVVNLFLGWTGIGWVVALVMAFRAAPRRPGAAVAPPR